MSSSTEEKRETGSAIMVIGWVMMLFALLVMFFQPAAARLGETRFDWIAGCLGCAGLTMSIFGVWMRRRYR